MSDGTGWKPFQLNYLLPAALTLRHFRGQPLLLGTGNVLQDSSPGKSNEFAFLAGAFYNEQLLGNHF